MYQTLKRQTVQVGPDDKRSGIDFTHKSPGRTPYLSVPENILSRYQRNYYSKRIFESEDPTNEGQSKYTTEKRPVLRIWNKKTKELTRTWNEEKITVDRTPVDVVTFAESNYKRFVWT